MNTNDLLNTLAELAMIFRGASVEQRSAIVSEYNATLRRLQATGWNDWLDPDSELPDELIDEIYLARRTRLPDEPPVLLRRYVRDYDALLMSVQSVGSQAYRGNILGAYSRRFEGSHPYDSKDFSFVGAGAAWGNKTLIDGETAIVFIRFSSGSYYQKPWHGHFTQRVINGVMCAVPNWHLLEPRVGLWKPDWLREAAFYPDELLQSKVAFPYDLFEKHLLDEIGLLA